ncbi:MAG: hypothetical protein NZ580_07705, partial [Bacteroidia bacterium]|nr:hypothetical protein [Bacteroidia bacterium]
MRLLRGVALFSLLGAQTITTTEPTLTVCGSAGTFSVTVQNTTGSPLTGVQLAVSMPPGILYEVGSVTAPATEVSTTPLNQPVFGLPNLAPGASVTFTFRAQARCAILDYLRDPNNEVKNTYQLTWNGGGSYTYTPSAEYNILDGKLDYLSITNQAYTAPIAPSTFTRTFTVRNDGDGRIASFQHIETAEPNLEILSASGGTIISHTAHALTLEFNSTHFASIGNGDNYFDPGEVITFQVEYRILACTNLGSTFSLT